MSTPRRRPNVQYHPGAAIALIAATFTVAAVAWLTFDPATAGTVTTLAIVYATAEYRNHRNRVQLRFAGTRISSLRRELADANTDPVTGLATRRVAEQHIRTTDPSTRLSVALIDVNRMHDLNNRYGHQFGDAYLHAIADRLAQTAFPGDLIARLGGDEFVYITTRPRRALAYALAAATRQPVSVHNTAIAVAISAGICCFGGSDPQTLFGCADLAMYTAKRRGSGLEYYDPARDGQPLPATARPLLRRQTRDAARPVANSPAATRQQP